MAILEDYPWMGRDKNGKVYILPQELYIWMKKEYFIRIAANSTVYVYQDGIYRPMDFQRLMAFIKGHLPPGDRSFLHFDAVRKELETDEIDVEIEDFDAREDLVCFQDVVLNLRTGETMEHSPEFLLTRKLPCRYNKDARLAQAKTFCQFLNDMQEFDKEAIIFLLEYMGAIFSNVKGYRFKKLLLLVGAGNTGKTQLRQLVINILGKDHTIDLDLKDLHSRFGPILLQGKRLSGYGDMSYVELDELNALKCLTGGDPIFGEKKGVMGYSFLYGGFLWYNTNRLPFFRGDRGEHMYKRFVIVQCENPIPEEKQDKHLLEKMMTEQETIINVAITMLRKALERGYRFSESQRMWDAREAYKVENNSLYLFMKDCVDFGQNYKVITGDFNRAYETWCYANQIKIERDREIRKQIEEVYPHIIYKKSNVWHYFGMKLNEDGEEFLNTFYQKNAR